jgi:hypothetical protein
MVGDQATFRRRKLPPEFFSVLSTGDKIREWSIEDLPAVFFPYEDSQIISLERSVEALRYMWPVRTMLGNRATFSGGTYLSDGRPWWGWHQLALHRLKPPTSIAFSDVATHNHFCLDLGGKVFDRHSPIIKLAADASDDEYFEILGLLNSSTACFWLKQVCYPKGGDHVGTEGARVTKNQWEERYEFDTTKLKKFPIPEATPLALAKQIHREAAARSALIPSKLCGPQVPTRSVFDAARDSASKHLAMIALQEELDWQCYLHFGIFEQALTLPSDQLPPLGLGERAFEILLARKDEENLWFERHSSTPITELPSHWTEPYRNLVERRIEVIDSNRDIALIECPEHKRRWNLPSWEEMESAALRGWLLDRMEANSVWFDHALMSCSQFRDALARDADWVSVAGVYSGGPVENLDQLVMQFALGEAVPFLPALRYTDAGLRKRGEWGRVWDLQRQQDAGEVVEMPIPPKYRNTDFKSSYWGLRGGLDVPKERVIQYPGLERDSDRSPVLGWAGWNHLEQAKALAGYYQRMRTEEGWEPERLKPILAGLLDLKPWLLQWHNDLDPETGVRLGEYFVQFAESQCQELGFSPEEVRAWQPASAATPAQHGRRATARKSQ